MNTTYSNRHANEPNPHDASLVARLLQGAGLAVCLTLLRFLEGFAPGGTILRYLQGFAAVAVGGAAGGAVYFFTDHWRAAGGARRTLANVASLLAYCLMTLGATLLMPF